MPARQASPPTTPACGSSVPVRPCASASSIGAARALSAAASIAPAASRAAPAAATKPSPDLPREREARTPPRSFLFAKSHFVALQAQPPPQRQVLLHWQRSPRLQRSAFTFAQPHEVFSHRHSVRVWFAIGSLLVRGAPSCALSRRETQTPQPLYTR